ASDKYAPRPEPAVEVMVAQADSSAEAAQLEAAWIARRILDLNGNLEVGPSGQERTAVFSDFAVLGRSLNALEPIREALLRAGIPALVAGGRTFYETREVRDLTYWLAVVANRRDEVALAGLLRSPLVGVRDETLLRLCTRGRLADSFDGLESLDLAAFDAGDRERLLGARARIERLGGMRDSLAPDRLAAEALDDSDYLSTLAPHGRANVEKFLGLLRGLYTARSRSLRETLDELARLREAASEPEAPPGESSNAVRLMSIHKSKGLEFPVVFVPALQRGTDPSKPVICFDPVAGLGVRWRDPAGSKGIADLVHRRFVSELEAREKAEENRLLYVAMTRAEERLVLSFGQTQKSGSEWVRLVSDGLGDDRLQVLSQAPDQAGAPAPSVEIQAEEIL
ncbi:MAG: 3'-5' exonuclease, partial [Acidobacteriota bacterium]